MKKSITKANVIKALKKEKLKCGWFFNSNVTINNVVDCSVCAVGAVLRHMSFEKWAIEQCLNTNGLGYAAVENKYISEDINQLLKEKNYLGALSNYFEDYHGDRAKTIAFVKKHFPNKLTITITHDMC